ncbi:MAG: hypothetical protein OER95_07975, partial [Acidimicrobiia bacterium]|nr:hypothetical protein [Acidimicrobiia bacterium]
MNRLAKLLALLLALTLFAAACGGDDSTTAGETAGSDETTAAEGGGVDEAAAEEAVAGAADEETPTDQAPAAGSIEELEAQWAEARQVVVDKIKAEGWGVDENNVLIGPEGFEIDLNNCPSDWSDTAGLDQGTIRIG